MQKLTSFPIYLTDQTANEISGGLCPPLGYELPYAPIASSGEVPTSYAIRKAIEDRLTGVVETSVNGNGVSPIDMYQFDALNRIGSLYVKSIHSLSDRVTVTQATSSIILSYDGSDTTPSILSGVYIQGGANQLLARMTSPTTTNSYSSMLMTLSANMSTASSSTEISGASDIYDYDISLGKIFIRTPIESAFSIPGESLSIGLASPSDVAGTYMSLGSFITHDVGLVSGNGEWQELEYNDNWNRESLYVTSTKGVYAKVESAGVTSLTGICEIRLMYDKISWGSDTIGAQCGDSNNPTILKWKLEEGFNGISDSRSSLVSVTPSSYFGAAGYKQYVYAVGGSTNIQKWNSSVSTNATTVGADSVIYTGRLVNQVAVSEDDMVIVGGYSALRGALTNIRMLDLTNDTGTAVADSNLSVARYFGVLAADDSVAYAFGGVSPLSANITSIEKWAKAASTVNTLATSLTYGEGPSLMSTDRFHYILGGADAEPLGSAESTTEYIAFDKSTETGSTHYALPWKFSCGLAFQNGQYGVIAGGLNYTAGVGTIMDTIAKFDWNNSTFSVSYMTMLRSLPLEAGANVTI